MAAIQRKPCKNLWDGHCKFGARCRFSHDPTTPCYHFLTRDGCRNGEDCFFSHEQPSSRTKFAPASSADSDYETRFRQWTYLIPKDHRERGHRQGPDITTFFKAGWDLVVLSDGGSQQRLIKKLASEEGLYMIKSLTQAMDIHGQEDQEALLFFHTAVLPFFQLMSHREIVSSLVLEHSVEQIHNFL